MKKKKVIRFLLVIVFIIACIGSYFIYNNIWNNTKRTLKVGSVVYYEPEEKQYFLEEKYICNKDDEKSIELNNKDDSLKIDKWRVLNIKDDMLELVPENIPSFELEIYGAKGYNNGVYVLNDICNELYSNKEKNIKARSINIEDIEGIIEKVGNNEKLNNIKQNTAFYGEQLSKEGYSKENGWYPIIFELEKNSIVDNNINSDGLDISDSKNQLIKDPEKKQSNNSFRIIKNFYKLKDYINTVSIFGGEENVYSNILLPQNKSTNYWIASRIIGNGKDCAHFDFRRVNDGILKAVRLYESSDIESGDKSKLFPVISVNINNIEKKSKDEYIIK